MSNEQGQTNCGASPLLSSNNDRLDALIRDAEKIFSYVDDTMRADVGDIDVHTIREAIGAVGILAKMVKAVAEIQREMDNGKYKPAAKVD